LVVIVMGMLFQIPTPVFLIKELAIEDLARGTLSWFAECVG
jgi:hypothetical protein